ncbi:MAG: hypothetical protein QOD99_151 [Chthoniobacter sp.]|jgi:MOSC domain-containing protein YiiM|nr:hypothetical protein [Chthoniobacter sp.]
MLQIHHLYIARAHNYFGHHGQPPGEEPMIEMREIECEAGRGICGDRFFDYKRNYKGQITFFSREVYEELRTEFGFSEAEKPPGVLRRNVVVSGGNLNDLVGVDFEIGGVHFRGTQECSPCHWMNEAVHRGAEQWLRGRGGLRAQILTSGMLRAG